MSDERGVTTAVGKLLEVGIVVLYITALTATLYGNVLPDYRSATADELGERVLAKAAYEVEDAVPSRGRAVAVRSRVALPETIRSDPYRIRATGRSLVLDHPHPAVDGRVTLVLPADVVRVAGEWRSDRPALVAIRSVEGGLAVSLATGTEVST